MKVLFTRREVTELQSFIKLGGHEFPFSEVWNVIDALENSDMMQRVVIYNTLLGETLEKLGVAGRNSRGSYARRDRFEAFQELLDRYDPLR